MDDELLRALARPRPRAAPDGEPSMQTSSEARHDAHAIDEIARPLSDAERESVLDAVFERLDAADVDATPSAAPVVQLGERKASRARLFAGLGVVLAIAAALVLWIAVPRPGPSDALPGYSITSLHGGDSAVRSDPQALDRVLVLESPDAPIDVVVSPAQAVAVPLAVTLVASGAGAAARMVGVEAAEISPSGAVRLRGPLSRFVALDRGAWELAIVVSPRDHVPANAAAALADRGLGRATVRVEIL